MPSLRGRVPSDGRLDGRLTRPEGAGGPAPPAPSPLSLPHPVPSLPTTRIGTLDLLRATAITLVVLCNAGVEANASGFSGQLAASGWIGVDLFFVLSGWLVGGLYWRKLGRDGTVETGRF